MGFSEMTRHVRPVVRPPDGGMRPGQVRIAMRGIRQVETSDTLMLACAGTREERLQAPGVHPVVRATRGGEHSLKGRSDASDSA
jgi:hypothetical protein